MLELRAYLTTLPSGIPVPVEAPWGWVLVVDELQAAGLDARLVNPLEAKKRMPGTKKTAPQDAGGLAMLLRNGTLPMLGFLRCSCVIWAGWRHGVDRNCESMLARYLSKRGRPHIGTARVGSLVEDDARRGRCGTRLVRYRVSDAAVNYARSSLASRLRFRERKSTELRRAYVRLTSRPSSTVFANSSGWLRL